MKTGSGGSKGCVLAWMLGFALLSFSARLAGAQPRVIGVYDFEEFDAGRPLPGAARNAMTGATAATAATLTGGAAAPDVVASAAPNKVALSFAKPGAAMFIPDSPDWATAASIRMETRLRLTSPSGGNSVAIVHRPQREGAPPLMNFYVNGNSLTLVAAVMMEGDRVETVETPMNTLNRWVYTAMTIQETTANSVTSVNMELYLDGSLRQRRTITGARLKRSRDTSLPGWVVGRAWDTSTAARWSNLNGPMDEIRLSTTSIPIAPLPNGASQPQSVFSNEPHLVPGSLSAVPALLPTTKFTQWDGKTGEDGTYATAMDGISVDVNGLPALVIRTNPATVHFVPSIEVPVPDSGVAQITVKGEFGSFVATSAIRKLAPAVAFWSLLPAQSAYAIAWGPRGMIGPDQWFLGGAFPMTPARPGEAVSLMASGLGPTNPLAPVDRPLDKDVTYQVETAESIYLNIGEAWVKADSAVLTAPGTYRIDFVVPEVPNGDHLIRIRIGDLSSGPALFSVRAPAPATGEILLQSR